jgi:hypothetical protein
MIVLLSHVIVIFQLQSTAPSAPVHHNLHDKSATSDQESIVVQDKFIESVST